MPQGAGIGKTRAWLAPQGDNSMPQGARPAKTGDNRVPPGGWFYAPCFSNPESTMNKGLADFRIKKVICVVCALGIFQSWRKSADLCANE